VTRAIPILMYHQIDAMPPAGTPFRHLTVTPAAFAAQMRWMHRLGYRGLSMRDLQPYLSGERRGRVFGITFDDGYLNVLRHALPVLRDVGFSATNYVVANRVGGTNDWDAAHGSRQVPLMSAGELRQWAAAGQEIGSHTTDHVDLTRQEPEQARAQIAWSRQLLQAMTDQPVDAFCFPYGATTNTTSSWRARRAIAMRPPSSVGARGRGTTLGSCPGSRWTARPEWRPSWRNC